MSSEASLEERLAAVEHAVADLQRQLSHEPTPAHWLDKVIGSISDESAFREALEFGRAFRTVDRPPDEADDKP